MREELESAESLSPEVEALMEKLRDRKMLALSKQITGLGERIDTALDEVRKQQAAVENQLERCANMQAANNARLEEIKQSLANHTPPQFGVPGKRGGPPA